MGFNYGDQWLRVDQLDHIIEDMNLVEPLKIKSDSIVKRTQVEENTGFDKQVLYDIIY